MFIYTADSIEAVREVAARTSLRFERVSEAVTDSGTRASVVRGVQRRGADVGDGEPATLVARHQPESSRDGSRDQMMNRLRR